MEKSMLKDSPLAWLDKREKQTENALRLGQEALISLFERQVHLITQCVEEIIKSKPTVNVTINELKNSFDGQLLRKSVPRFVLVHAMDHLQAGRLNILHGYFSVAYSCMRNVVESLRWTNASQHSVRHALAWLNNTKYPGEHGFELDPPIKTIWKKFGDFSQQGSHSFSRARTYSALGKCEAKSLLGEERQQEGIELTLRIVNQISANFLIWMTHSQSVFAQRLENNTALEDVVQKMLVELNQTFGIKQVGTT